MMKFPIFDFRLPDERPARSAHRAKPAIPHSGMALVVCLALIVLITAAVLAFFARATSNRVVEASRANRVEAEQLARTAADYVASVFLQEIAAGSTRYGSDGTTENSTPPFIYRPTTNLFAVPHRPLPSAMAGDTNFANLIRRSVNETVDGFGETNASADSTITASKNGRTIGPDRWNTPMLLSGAGFTAADQLPNWIYANADGSVTNSPGTNTIGRFAYNVYTTGGLLDANAAGYPNTVSAGTTNMAELKSSLAGADLSVIPGITDVNAFVTWRNTNNVSSATNYVTAVGNSSTNGFLRAQPGDNRILSRQDLISLARTGTHGLTTNALPYLTTFARSENAPSWQPKTNATGASFQYRANADLPASINRNLPNVRVSAPFIRRDGCPATAGEPLLKKRFPLDKISLLASSGNAANIMSYFGLTATAAGWTYDHGDSHKIKTLNEVALAGREPDFFELLKAVILDGSLGRDPGATDQSQGPAGAGFEGYSTYPDMQILQIGANIIDQYDEDSFPTAIFMDQIPSFGQPQVSTIMQTVYGIENIPYLYRMVRIDYLLPGGGGRIAGWYQPIIWNPHGQPPSIPGPGLVPQKFRVNTYGNTIFNFMIDAANPVPGDVWQSGPSMTFSGGSPGQIAFPLSTAQASYANPLPLTSANILAGESGPDNLVQNPAQDAGVFIGSPSPIPANVDSSNKNQVWCSDAGNPDMTFVLEYQDASGGWHPYTHLARLAKTSWVWYGGYQGDADGVTGNVRADPRTDRFSIGTVFLKQISPSMPKTETLNASTYVTALNPPRQTSGFQYPHPSPFDPSGSWWYAELGDLAKNVSTDSMYYRDLDGVIRPADGSQAVGQDGRLGDTGGTTHARRPIVLNRAFQSVGDLAYTFRDLPFKSLDFSSKDSGDMGLLDVFCLAEDTNLVGGRVNLNSASVPVLKSLFIEATKKEISPAITLTDTEAQALANGLSAWIASSTAGQGPLLDRADLGLALATIVQGSGFTVADRANKNLREAALRAIVSHSDTRTWNLLIDVVAQAGSFPASSTAAGSFQVKGEKRLWIHLAIDRYTGRIIAKQLETVNE